MRTMPIKTKPICCSRASCYVILLSLILTISVGCGVRPKLSGPHELKGSRPWTEVLAAAPVIVTALIQKVEDMTGDHHAGELGVPQLFRITVDIELVLRGPIKPADHLEVYTFLLTSSMVSVLHLGFAVGELAVFYLEKEAGVWRTICDLNDFCADQILTGSHSDFTRNLNRPIGDDILRILVIPSSTNRGDMVNALSNPFNAIRWKIERRATYIELLRQVSQHAAPPVAVEACIQLKKIDQSCNTCDYFK